MGWWFGRMGFFLGHLETSLGRIRIFLGQMKYPLGRLEFSLGRMRWPLGYLREALGRMEYLLGHLGDSFGRLKPQLGHLRLQLVHSSSPPGQFQNQLGHLVSHAPIVPPFDQAPPPPPLNKKRACSIIDTLSSPFLHFDDNRIPVVEWPILPPSPSFHCNDNSYLQRLVLPMRDLLLAFRIRLAS